MARNALGRGLGALIREPIPEPEVIPVVVPAAAAAAAAPAESRMTAGFRFVDIDLIDPSPYQPRTHFPEESTIELARSIQSSGIVQPLVVRSYGNRFQLMAGERRWRAAQYLALERVPVVVREVGDEQAIEITLIENIQREDLNAVEEARAYERFMNEFHLTQEEVAQRTGKERTTVANALRLLRLEKPLLDLVEEGRLSAGHARALLGVADPEFRAALAKRASRGGLTVRQIEKLGARRARAAKAAVAAPVLDPNTRAAVEQLQQTLGTRVQLRRPTKTKPGQLQIEYYDEEQLASIYDRLNRE
jgi:ParB family chromosome partitioning protein